MIANKNCTYTAEGPGRCQSLLQIIGKGTCFDHPPVLRSPLLVYAHGPEMLISVGVCKVKMHFFAFDIF